MKRHPDVELVNLEDEIRASGLQEPRRLEGLCWSSSACESVLLSDVVTSPSMFDVEVNSIRFQDGSQDAKSESFMLEGRRVLIWKSDAGVDDSTLEELPEDLVFSGMQEELTNLERCQTGRAILEHEVKTLKAKNPSLRRPLEPFPANRLSCKVSTQTSTTLHYSAAYFHSSGLLSPQEPMSCSYSRTVAASCPFRISPTLSGDACNTRMGWRKALSVNLERLGIDWRSSARTAAPNKVKGSLD